MRVYKDGDGVECKAWFESVPNEPAVPLSAHWRLRCLTSGTVLQDWTELTPVEVYENGVRTGVYAIIEIDGTLNAIRDATLRRETKQLQVVAAKGTPRQRSEWYEYAIANGDY